MSNASTIRCLITAGPTREYLDPARFLSNPSTGKMGFAIAEAALEMGWTVDLVAGPVDLQEPDGAILYPVTSADEMLQQVDALFDACDLLIMTAAVADFRPAERLPQKEKKAEATLNLALQPTVDILKTMVQRRAQQVVVGFAAESERVLEHAKQKLLEKDLDWIVANQIGQPGTGFAGDHNELWLLARDGTCHHLTLASKRALAAQLVEYISADLSV
jgi:phosphopantothenoylcysteine decarboxylase/phosphopantothenate--cysteine ligase